MWHARMARKRQQPVILRTAPQRARTTASCHTAWRPRLPPPCQTPHQAMCVLCYTSAKAALVTARVPANDTSVSSVSQNTSRRCSSLSDDTCEVRARTYHGNGDVATICTLPSILDARGGRRSRRRVPGGDGMWRRLIRASEAAAERQRRQRDRQVDVGHRPAVPVDAGRAHGRRRRPLDRARRRRARGRLSEGTARRQADGRASADDAAARARAGSGQSAGRGLLAGGGATAGERAQGLRPDAADIAPSGPTCTPVSVQLSPWSSLPSSCPSAMPAITCVAVATSA